MQSCCGMANLPTEVESRKFWLWNESTVTSKAFAHFSLARQRKMKPQKTFSPPLKTWSSSSGGTDLEKSVQKCAPDDKSFKSTAGMLESKNSCRTTIWSRERAESSSSSSPTVRPCKTVRAGKEVVTMKKATKISPFFGRRKLLQTILIF